MIDIEDFKKSIGKKSRLLGIDPGKNRVGLAISDEDKLVSTPLKTIIKKNSSNFIKEIKEIINENGIKGIIVGNPINMDGSKGPSSQSANDFAKHLSNNISIPVSMWDERLSSEGAFNLSSNLDINVSKKVEKLDQNAASFILCSIIISMISLIKLELFFLTIVFKGVETSLSSSDIAKPTRFLPGSIPNNLDFFSIDFLKSSISIMNMLYFTSLSNQAKT